MEKEMIQKRFTKAQSSYNEHAIAQQQIHARLTQLLLRAGAGYFPRILEIGCGTGGFTRSLAACCEADEWVLNDLCAPSALGQDVLSGQAVRYLAGDAEALPFPGTFNLIASASAIQWFSRPDTFIERVTEQLAPTGILLLNTFGTQNLREVKALTGKGLVYPTLQTVRNWLPESMDIITLEEEEIQLSFPSPLHVLRHLKYTGVTAVDTTVWTRGMQQRFCAEYLRRYSRQDSVTVTYRPIYLLAVKRK